MRAVMAPVILSAILCSAGCGASHHAPGNAIPAAFQLNPESGLSVASFNGDIKARCAAPLGWTPEPLKSGSMHTHQVWLSPSGETAYGVIHFSLPLPVGTDPVLWAFLNEMRKVEGEASLIQKNWDPNRHALHFVAEGGLYTVRANLMVRGFEGWAVYAGTQRSHAIVPEELSLAERARDRTEVGSAATDQ